jgi:hypothetical protein
MEAGSRVLLDSRRMYPIPLPVTGNSKEVRLLHDEVDLGRVYLCRMAG